jgi:3-oxoadipate enol-lactonase
MSDGQVRLYREITGPADGPVLLLANTLGSTLSVWDGQIDRLAEHFRVVRFDHRGHGRSPVPSGPYAIADLGRDALGLLDELEVERAHICGVSIGAMTAIWMAANAADRIDRLVLCSASARLTPAEAWRDRAALVRTHGTRAIAPTVVDHWFTRWLKTRRPDVVEAMEEMVASTPAEGYAGCAEAMGAMDLRGALGRIRASTLVVAGAEDLATHPEHQRTIARGISDARYVEVERAAHVGIVEEPGVFGDLILSHLTGSPGETGEALSPLGAAAEPSGESNLDPRLRSAVALATLVALRAEEELTASQVKECLRVGMSVAEIEEVLRITARDAGVPAANAGLAVLEAAVDASGPDVG